MRRQAKQARDLIGPFSPAALDALQQEAATLPARCSVFSDTLLAAGEPVASAVERIGRVLAQTRARHGDAATVAVHAAVRRADSPVARVAVAKAIVALREAGAVDEHLAAAVLVALPTGVSLLTEAALLETGVLVSGVATEPEPVAGTVPVRDLPAATLPPAPPAQSRRRPSRATA
ncbi:MAG: hypothetical protein ACHQNA_00470 [Acidimicrobiales bacterium]